MLKKNLMICVALVLCLLMFAGCECEHEWADATCTEPKTCTKCGETEGEVLGHKWTEATCTEPKKCSRCGTTEGEALGHEWIAATCTEPKTCSVCKETEGKALGHTWVDATCTEPKTCSVCGETKGEALGHSIKDWNVTKEATCTEEGQESGECTVCGTTIDRKIDKTEHTPGDWVITKEATWNLPGERTKSCTICGEVLETEEYEMDPAEAEAEFKASCQEYSYEEVARDPDSHYLEHAKYTGQVVQVMEGKDGDLSMRVNITPTSYGGYTDTIYVYCMAYTREGKSRILEDDIVTVYGYNWGLMSYESVMGAKITIPEVVAEYVDVN